MHAEEEHARTCKELRHRLPYPMLTLATIDTYAWLLGMAWATRHHCTLLFVHIRARVRVLDDSTRFVRVVARWPILTA